MPKPAKKRPATDRERKALTFHGIDINLSWTDQDWASAHLPGVRIAARLLRDNDVELEEHLAIFASNGVVPDMLDGWKRLLKGVVPRWSDRVIVTGLRNIAWDDGLAETMCEMYEELSAYIEGHSHTDEAMGAPPEIKDLVDMIPRVDALLKGAKQDRKAQVAALKAQQS
jgi:hypothetical protein